MGGARPGWYPDPGGGAQGRYRWWNGDDWTDAVSDSAHAPRPHRATAIDRPAVRSRPHVVAALSIGIALLAVAGLVLGLVVWQDPARPDDPAKAGLSPRPSATGVPGELDTDSREAIIGAATMTLPDAPYVLETDPKRAATLFDSYFVAGATVHDDYRDGRDWSALVGLAQVASETSRTDPEATAAAVTQGIATRFFDHQATTVDDLSVAEHAVDGCSGVLVTARVRYRIDGLASRADRVNVLVVRLDDGTEVAAFSSVPTDAAPSLRNQAARALDSLHID